MKQRHKRFERLEDVYQYIVNYKIQCDGVSPTIRQICKGTNVSSTYVVYTHIEKLKDDGRINYILGDKGKVSGYAVTGGQWKSPNGVQRLQHKRESLDWLNRLRQLVDFGGSGSLVMVKKSFRQFENYKKVPRLTFFVVQV